MVIPKRKGDGRNTPGTPRCGENEGTGPNTQSYVWWSGIDQEIKTVARKCVACQEHKNAPAKAPLHLWSWLAAAWVRVHTNFAGPVDGKMLLVFWMHIPNGQR